MTAISQDDIPTELIEQSGLLREVPTDRTSSDVGRMFRAGAVPESDWPPTPSTVERQAVAMGRAVDAERGLVVRTPRHAFLGELLLWLVVTLAGLAGLLVWAR